MTPSDFKNMAKIYIGIDAGTKTGLAIWDKTSQQFIELLTVPIHTAMEWIKAYNGEGLTVVVEDARQVRFNTSPEKAQGAGYVKAHAQIWEAFLEDKGISYEMRRPNKAMTKWDADRFKRQTGWQGRTTTHSRDAALLVFGL